MQGMYVGHTGSKHSSWTITVALQRILSGKSDRSDMEDVEDLSLAPLSQYAS